MAVKSAQVSFFSGGNRLSAILTHPVEAAPTPAVVLCQGTIGLKEHYRFPELAGFFAEAGIATLIFDYVGFGSSEGPRNQLFPLDQVRNVRDAVSYLSSAPEVDPRRIGLVGYCWGGAHAVYAGAVDPRVRCVAEVVGMADGARWLRALRRYCEWREFSERLERDRTTRVRTGVSEMIRMGEVLIGSPMAKEGRRRIAEIAPKSPPYVMPDITLESVDQILAYRPGDVVGQLSPRPLLIVHAEEDDLTPVDEAHALFNAAGDPKELVVYPDAYHHSVYLDPLFGMIASRLRDWLVCHLMPNPTNSTDGRP